MTVKLRTALVVAFGLAIAATGVAQDDCADGVVKDDGSVETGYGWVPSVVEGVYVQEFRELELGSPLLASVCVCWLRTRLDDDIDFDVVFYQREGDLPAEEPYAVVPARAEDVPDGVASGGRFYEVDVSGVPAPNPGVYIGVRWNASVDQFFFVCADTSPETEPVQVFFIDDRAEGWTSALETTDPMFADHRAIMVRTVPEQVPSAAVPAVGFAGVALLVIVLAGAGFVLARTL
jgi:hypothetical protein